MFGHERDGLWSRLSWIGLFKDGGHNGIGSRTWESWKGLMSRMGLVWICSMDSPWEVLVLEVRVEYDEGTCYSEGLDDEGVEGYMNVSWK